MSARLTHEREAEPVGYFCDHSDEPRDARTHHDWEFVEGEGFVFQHRPETTSAFCYADRPYLKPEDGEKRCARAVPLYTGPVLAAVCSERDELAARARRVAVSHEHFIWDHSDPGTEALAAQYELINHLAGTQGETELPLNPAENALRVVLALLDEYDEDVTPGEIRKTLAEFLPREDMSDRRRRIYIDGKGDGWIDAGRDAETGEQDVGGVTNPWKIAAADEVRSDTGSLREIGRCW